jgi:hypothetical protein
MTIYLRALLVIALLVPTLAQQQGERQTQPTAGTAGPAEKPAGLTVDSVVAMVDAGLSEEVIIARLRSQDKGFDLTTEEMIRLKQSKVSDAVLQVMLDPHSQVRQPATQAIAGIRTPNASGATPAPGSEAKGDPSDPMIPHDSGIYLMAKSRDGKLQMVVLERASYQGAKSGGFLGSAMTYGIVKAKTKAIINGPHASIRVNETSPVFYFYFDDKQAGLGKTYFGVGNLSNPNQFSLVKLEVTKQNRESTVGTFSALGSSSGAESKAIIPFKSERIRPGLYKVSVESIKPGEYCFVASSNSGVQSPFGMTATAATDIFDFGVSVQ